MSPDTQAILISTLTGAVPVAVALAIRLRGPRGLIRGVDWTQVSDPDGLAHYLSLIFLAIGALIMLYGPLDVALRADPALHDAVAMLLGAVLAVLFILRWFVKRRFQRVAASDGNR